MAAHQTSVSKYPSGYHQEYIGDQVIAVATVFIVLEVICVGLRFWARKIGKVAWGLDDSLMIPSVIVCLGLIGCCIVDVNYGGVGHHQATLAVTDPPKLIVWAKFALVVAMMYLLAVILPKLAILVLFLRILTKRRYRVVCWVLAALMIGNLLIMMTFGFLICVPLNFLWDRTIPGGHCINMNLWYRWSSLMNIITDVIMLMLPQPVIWKLQTSTQVKIGLTLTFLTASIGLITSIVRFRIFFSENAIEDVTWSATRLIVFTIVETGIYLIAACLPTYRPLAIYIWRKMPLPTVHPTLVADMSKQPEDTHAEREISLAPYDGSSTRLNKERTNTSSSC